MDFSEDIEEESPCLIVPDSQTEERGTVQGCDPTHGCSLKELAMSRPTILPAEVSTSSGETEDGSREPKANNQIVGENVVEKDYIDKETGDRRGSGQDKNSSKSSGRDGTEQCNEGFENQSEKGINCDGLFICTVVHSGTKLNMIRCSIH